MPIHLTQNPYKGINAHFNSLLQNIDGGWLTFHSDQIVRLKSVLNQALPAGYYAVTEQSLQIQVSGWQIRPTRPDVTILYQGTTASPPSARPSTTPTLELATTDLAPQEDELVAVVIYQKPEVAVARIELLSPSNKTTDRNHYLAMRQKTLSSGLKLVEIDYLHETPPLFPDIQADYSKHEVGAYPYSLILSDPTPSAEHASGTTRFYSFHVDDPIPALVIPLLDDDAVLLDFDAAYRATLADDRRAHLVIDYAQEPLNLGAYSPDDQQRIRQVMQRIPANPTP